MFVCNSCLFLFRCYCSTAALQHPSCPPAVSCSNLQKFLNTTQHITTQHNTTNTTQHNTTQYTTHYTTQQLSSDSPRYNHEFSTRQLWLWPNTATRRWNVYEWLSECTAAAANSLYWPPQLAASLSRITQLMPHCSSSPDCIASSPMTWRWSEVCKHTCE